MKRIFWLAACFFSLSATAQEKLYIMGTASDLYVIHTVMEGETVQNISNRFGQSVAKLAAYNQLTAGAPLAKGLKIKIPLTAYNLIHVKGDESSAPVYHIIRKGENLYRVSKANSISVPVLKEWNSLTSDIVQEGQPVIVGYMVNAKGAVQKKEKAVKDISTGETGKVEPAILPATAKNASKNAVKKDPATARISKSAAVLPEAATIKEPVAVPDQKKETLDYVPKDGDEGYFSLPYSQHTNDQAQQFHSGDAAIFKTISGWTDRKYYVLMNDVNPETIVRITGTNNRSICAKVLGPLQETKGGSGLLLRMSNSAAAAIGMADAKFTVTVTYYE